jgi:hypothetical protein
LERLTVASEASATAGGKRNGNVKVALNSNQVKSPQAGVHADGGGLYLVVRESGDRVWAFRFTDLDGKRAQMEFARVGDRDSAAGDVLTLSSARNKAREYKVALKRDGVDPRIKKRATTQRGKTSRNFTAAAPASVIGAPITRTTIFAVKCWSSVCRIASAMRPNYRIGTAR